MVKSEPVMYTGSGLSIKGVVPLGRGEVNLGRSDNVTTLQLQGVGVGGRWVPSHVHGVACKQFFVI